MRQVNIRLSDEEYDQLVRECGPGATVSGYVTAIVRRYFESASTVASFAGVPAREWRPFSKQEQVGKGKK